MNDETMIVTCARHGLQPAAFVCNHILQYTGKGFFTPDSERTDSDEAWCLECEQVLMKEGRWNKRATKFANFRVVCAVCFKRLRAVGTIHAVK